MRLLDTYALYCGAKIDKPFIYESYFPTPFDKYVTFQAETPYDSRNYSYWQDVIDMIVPVLSKNGIPILQLGLAKEMGYQRVVNLLGQTNLHQLAYLTRRSSLHFGPDSFGVHLASHFDIPLVSLYSISMPEVAGPHFGSPDKHALFKGYERVGNKKPSYSPQERPKSIDTIRPEEIANAIFRLLNFEFKVPFETVFTGSRYSSRIVREMIPNSPLVLAQPEQPIEIRCDLHFDVQILTQQLNYWQKAVLITDKPIDINLLRHFKPRIAFVVYYITENDAPSFVRDVAQLGIPLVLVSRLSPDVIQQKKLQYYEYGVINVVNPTDETTIQNLRKDLDVLYYRSCKIIASNGKIFKSHADEEAGKVSDNEFEYHRVIDSPKFWQDLDFFTIVKKI